MYTHLLGFPFLGFIALGVYPILWDLEWMGVQGCSPTLATSLCHLLRCLEIVLPVHGINGSHDYPTPGRYMPTSISTVWRRHGAVVWCECLFCSRFQTQGHVHVQWWIVTSINTRINVDMVGKIGNLGSFFPGNFGIWRKMLSLCTLKHMTKYGKIGQLPRKQQQQLQQRQHILQLWTW